MSIFNSLKNKSKNNASQEKYLSGFSKTNKTLGQKLRLLVSNNYQNKDEFIEKLMITLIEGDVGYKTSQYICDKISTTLNSNLFSTNNNELMDKLLETIYSVYNETEENEIIINENGPTVIFLIGINGSGKTSTCAKLANMYKNQGKSVCLAAGDTFRAGAKEQLEFFAKELNIDIITGKDNEDPSSVLVNACRYVKEKNIDILICDTAGRLQTKSNLMAELAKMRRVVGKEVVGAPHNVWLVIDSNTGQNGISQAELFNESTQLTGTILTKTDGTSKGGIVLAIKHNFGIPVKFITLGETIDDIKEFNFDLYLYSILGELNET